MKSKEELNKVIELKLDQDFWLFRLHRVGGRMWNFDIHKITCKKVNKLTYSVNHYSTNIHNSPIRKDEIKNINGYYLDFDEAWKLHGGDTLQRYVNQCTKELEMITEKNPKYEYFKNLKVWFEDLIKLLSGKPLLENYEKFKVNKKNNDFQNDCLSHIFGGNR